MVRIAVLIFALFLSYCVSGQALTPLPGHPENLAWPTEAWSKTELAGDVDKNQLDAALDALFAAKKASGIPDTRAVLVIKSGQIVLEQYAEGFDASTRFHSWSVAKSFTNAIIGTLVKAGKLDLDQANLIPDWASDRRREITLRQMLNMTSGLDNADQAEDGFLGEAMFGTGALDVNQAIIPRPLLNEPGETWAYSTATSNLLGYIAGELTGENRRERHEYVLSHLLEPIGAPGVILGYDRAGYFMGGSHVYATAREYARLGYLYLRDGVWAGERILPAGWVDFSRQPAPASNNGNHGAHLWLNKPGKGWQPPMLPGGPESVFVMSGNGGQYVYIVPTHDLVVVRLGEKQLMSWSELAEAMANLVAAFPPITAEAGEAAQ